MPLLDVYIKQNGHNVSRRYVTHDAPVLLPPLPSDETTRRMKVVLSVT